MTLYPFGKYLSCFNIEKYINEMSSHTKVETAAIRPTSYIALKEVAQFNLQSILFDEQIEKRLNTHKQKKASITHRIKSIVNEDAEMEVNQVNKFQFSNMGNAFKKVDQFTRFDITQDSNKISEGKQEVDLIGTLGEEQLSDIFYKTEIYGNHCEGLYRKFATKYTFAKFNCLKEFILSLDRTLIGLITVDSSESIVVKYLFFEFLYVFF